MKGAYGLAPVVCITALGWMSERAQGQMSPAAGWEAMTRCAAIADDMKRHKCSDDVLRGAGLLPSEAAEKRKSFGVQTSPVRPAIEAVPEAPKRPSDDQLQVTLAAVAQGGDGKLVLTTTDGAMWRQVESTAVRPTPAQGQLMTIERTSFGGFMCKSGRWVAFRCYRTR